eukprot:TRINITY_DN3009_c0_g4_i2.p1 TRINITY_DN3009_c0_g4~~TRINITY_DN3009_c0_g4_i2.p1  ORF type:complete len:403 (+),score=83.86 TRINITY_DN3009_c0_g4_i2:9-1217(+)
MHYWGRLLAPPTLIIKAVSPIRHYSTQIPPHNPLIPNNDGQKEAQRAKQRQYYHHNKEVIKQQQKAYYLKNKTKIYHQRKMYRLTHKDSLQEKQRLYRLKNYTTLKLQKANYNSNNRQQVDFRKRLYNVRNAHKRSLFFRNYWERNKGSMKLQQAAYRRNNKERRKEGGRAYYIYCKYNTGHLRRPYQRNPLMLYKVRRDSCMADPKVIWKCFEKIRRMLHIGEPLDWYRVSQSQMDQVGGGPIHYKFGDIGKALQWMYPEEEWNQHKFSIRQKKSTQRWLRVMLQQILPPKTLIFEDFLHPDLLWDETTDHKMELDLWVPQFNLALEYQGEQHYIDIWVYGSSALHQKRDLKKKESCETNGITLMTIPYWWDRTKESLSSELYLLRPDIFMKPTLLRLQSG